MSSWWNPFGTGLPLANSAQQGQARQNVAASQQWLQQQHLAQQGQIGQYNGTVPQWLSPPGLGGISQQSLEISKTLMKLAQEEIDTFEPLTKQILQNLKNSDEMKRNFMLHNDEMVMADLGRVINPLVKNAGFAKKLEDIIND